MKNLFSFPNKRFIIISWIIVLFGLYLISLYNYLLFHSVAEIFSVIIAGGIFIVAWNSRQLMASNYLLFLGIAYLFIGGLDLVHTLAYKGIGVFEGYGSNVSTQVWIASRYVESASLLIAPLWLTRKLKVNHLFFGYSLATSILLMSIFYWQFFPDSFVEGTGITHFKKISEYMISLTLIGSMVFLFKKRKAFDEIVFKLIIFSLVFTVAAELSFTFYINAYGFSNLIGHYFKIISFYLIYKAIIETGLVKPHSLKFWNLKQSEVALMHARAELERRVEEKTSELMATNALLNQKIKGHKKTEDALRKSELKLIEAQRIAHLGNWDLDLVKNKLEWSSETYRIFALKPQEFEGTYDAFLERVHADDKKFVDTSYKNSVTNHVPYDIVHRIVRPGGEVRYVHERAKSITDGTGKAIQLIGTVQDVTERRELEKQLHLSQKMEAVGKLAGGIAHDFNNFLTSILGYADLVLMKLEKDNPLKEYMTEINKACRRAASLTRQLLAFSRKQIFQTKVLNLNDVISDMEKMLRRLIGEDIELKAFRSHELGNVEVDQSQVEQVIMNLTINGRDAMPQGGKLTIETANVNLDESYARKHSSVKPGPYVMMAISDNGIGMDKETQFRIFEPFFTTKELGKGTGLGLSTVYGIIKQSGGYIWIYSEPGTGTTFKIYLPRVDKTVEQVEQEIGPKKSLKGSETILVVEDNDMVRQVAFEIFLNYGYTVLEAKNGEAAIEICKQHEGPIHLMIADVVMPKMGGRKLAKYLESIRKETKVLYMSGYTEDTIVHRGILPQGMNFLQKPFTHEMIANKVRELLDDRQTDSLWLKKGSA